MRLIGYLSDPTTNASNKLSPREVEMAARVLGVRLAIANASTREAKLTEPSQPWSSSALALFRRRRYPVSLQPGSNRGVGSRRWVGA
jgi:hypothetical protein